MSLNIDKGILLLLNKAQTHMYVCVTKPRVRRLLLKLVFTKP